MCSFNGTAARPLRLHFEIPGKLNISATQSHANTVSIVTTRLPGEMGLRDRQHNMISTSTGTWFSQAYISFAGN